MKSKPQARSRTHRLRPLPAPPLRRTRRRPRASSLSIGRGWRCRLDLFAWQAALWLSGYETSAAGPGLPWPGFQWPCQVAVAARGWATRIRLGPDPESTAGPGLPAAGGRWPLRGSGPGCQLARWPASCCRSAVQNPPSADGTAAGPPAQWHVHWACVHTERHFARLVKKRNLKRQLGAHLSTAACPHTDENDRHNLDTETLSPVVARSTNEHHHDNLDTETIGPVVARSIRFAKAKAPQSNFVSAHCLGESNVICARDAACAVACATACDSWKDCVNAGMEAC